MGDEGEARAERLYAALLRGAADAAEELAPLDRVSAAETLPERLPRDFRGGAPGALPRHSRGAPEALPEALARRVRDPCGQLA